MHKLALLAAVTLLCAFLVPASGIAGDEGVAALPTDACGVRPPAPGGGYWECRVAEDFNGTSLDRSRWTPLVQPATNGIACNIDSPATHQVVDGMLRITVLPVGNGLVCPPRRDGTRALYASASISTAAPNAYPKWSQQYGRFEVRYRNTATRAPGLHEAFWLWPARASDWTSFGELDIVETYSRLPDTAVPHLHDRAPATEGVNTASNCRSSRGEWHTYTLEWSAERIEIFVDGKSCLVNTTSTAMFGTAYTMALTMILGDGWNSFDGRAPLPATMEVDYVRVWR